MRRLFFIAVPIAAAGLWACGEDAAPAAAPPAPAARKAAAAVDAGVAAARPQYVYSYNALGKRDPFRNMSAETVVDNAGPKLDIECNEPLCHFEIDDLKVVAVISGDANPLAMLEDPSHVGHIVHRNTKVGKQGGKVTAIERDCLVVTSYIAGADGKAQANKVKMCIKPDEKLQEPVDLLLGK